MAWTGDNPLWWVDYNYIYSEFLACGGMIYRTRILQQFIWAIDLCKALKIKWNIKVDASILEFLSCGLGPGTNVLVRIQLWSVQQKILCTYLSLELSNFFLKWRYTHPRTAMKRIGNVNVSKLAPTKKNNIWCKRTAKTEKIRNSSPIQPQNKTNQWN